MIENTVADRDMMVNERDAEERMDRDMDRAPLTTSDLVNRSGPGTAVVAKDRPADGYGA